jgi:mRNA interferase MazF
MRGELYRVNRPPGNDPKQFRVFVVVSRQVLINSRFSTVICAPIYTAYEGISTQVPVGPDEGLKHNCSIHCDELVSLLKANLTRFVGSLPAQKMTQLDQALHVALQLQED